MKERIHGPALRSPDNDVYGDPIPASHYSVSQSIKKLLHDDDMQPLKWEQGFLTNTGRFVSREEAYKIAKAAHQIVAHDNGRFLFSESLWK